MAPEDEYLPERTPPKRGLGWRPNLQRTLDATRKAKFLEELAKHGIVGQAAKRASLHSHNGCLTTFYRERERDPEFAEAWEEAMWIARGDIEGELHRRAVEGYEEPVFYLGKEVGTVRKYSDALLLARIRALAPEYRQQQKIEHSGSVETKPLDLDKLPPHKRELLRELLKEDARSAPLKITVDPVGSSFPSICGDDSDSEDGNGGNLGEDQ